MEIQVEALLRGGHYKQILDTYMSEFKSRYGLKRTEIEVLYYLSRRTDSNTAKDITSSLHMNKGHISQTMDALCQRGYLEATRDIHDYRIVHYNITDEAERIVKEIDDAIDKLYKALFAGIAPQDIETLKRIAIQIEENIARIKTDITDGHESDE